ncbi:hypothetical protein [Blastochloris tepida]|uniref:Uncharacterized protein n=1 Tax=Blastochloris tepida TaxID=2233851 RepID=A0A348FZW3_9HYPH|nr:hypothetical protein [Blastochloris tepida]BBF92846.1 hypothetical protein BLTE_15310 [Blastochloris tepida]
MTDAAHVLFPNDAPAAKAATGPAGKDGPGQGDAKPPAPAAGDPEPDAARSIFRDEPDADDAAARDVTDTFGSFAISAANDGDMERCHALQAAGETLLADVREAGGLASDLAEALGYVKAAADRFAPATEEENQAGMAKALATLQAERTDHAALEGDLAAARRLIVEMDRRTPGLIEQLELTGAGNDPRLIKAAIKEARRRGL